MRPRLLALVGALALPSWGAAQSARIGAQPGPGGTVVGRVCMDLDRDGACSDGEPGVGGARLRFEDGRRATADEEGRFHVVEVSTRLLLADRGAYGDHAVAVDGLEVVRRFELAPRGTASIDLAVPMDPGAGASWSLEPWGTGSPTLAQDRILWPLSGAAAPGAWVRAAGQEARAGADGRWTLAVPLGEGVNAVGVAAGADGTVALWLFEVRVARPGSGALRVYPARPRRLASLKLRLAGDGVAVAGVASPGVELRFDGRVVRPSGDGHFAAWAGIQGGALVARASVGGTSVEAAIPTGPGETSLRGLVLGELELQAGGHAGFLASGRLAGAASGRWRGFELEAGVDLDDRDRGALDVTSPRDVLGASTVIDPLRAFVETGDRGGVEDANRERGRLWGALTGHGLQLSLGTTRGALGDAELGSYGRQLFGARVTAGGDLGPVRADAIAFGSRAGADVNGLSAGAPCQDQLAASGGSLFYLSRRSLIAGSERVRVEWRDPISRLTVASRELARGRDYDLDAVGGRLLLTRPLGTSRPLAALVGGDPFAAAEAWLVVDYLGAELDAGRHDVAGGELRARLGPVAVAVGGASESRPGPDWQLVRGSGTLDLGAPLRARIELARSDGTLFGVAGAGRATSLDGGFTFGGPASEGAAASAVHARLEGEVGGARWLGWWRERATGYSDGAFEQRSAARERGALASGQAGAVALRLAWVEQRGPDPLDPDGVARRDLGRGFASAGLSLGSLDLALEALHERVTLPERGFQSGAGVRAGWRAGGGLTLEAAHLQAFAASGAVEERTFTSAGASLRMKEGGLALRAGWGPELGPRVLLSGERGDGAGELYGTLAIDPIGPVGPVGPVGPAAGSGDGSAVGGRQRIDGGTLFTEERVARDPWGVVAGRVVGASLTPIEGLALVLSAERGERRLAGGTIARSVGAASAAWDRGPVRLDARGELRTEGSGRQWLAGAGAGWTPAPRLTVSARVLASDGEIQGHGARGGEGWLSAAWRADALSVLARLGRVKDQREGIAERDATVGAVAVTARPARRAALGLGVDYARQTVGGAGDDRLAGSVRAEMAVLGPVDVALEYARRGSFEGREIGDLDALRAEAGLTAGLVRLAVGYTLVGFAGTGIDPEEEGDGRFYLRAVLVR